MGGGEWGAKWREKISNIATRYVCVHARIYVCVHASICVSVHACVYVCVCNPLQSVLLS